MSKYTPEKLKEMAEEVLCAYNLNDMKADMLIMHISNIMRCPPEKVIATLHELCKE